MRLEIDILDAARDRPEADWDDFVVNQDLPACWHAEPIHTYAGSAPDAVFLARAFLDGEVAAQACFRTARPGLAPRRFRDPRALPRPVLLRCSVPVSFHSGLAFAAGLEPDDRVRVLAELHRRVRQRFAPWCRAVVYESVPPAQRHLFESCPVTIRHAPVAVLPIRWADFDGFLAGLPGPRRRRFSQLLSRVADDPAIDAFDLAPDIDGVEATGLELATRLRHQRRPAGAAPLPAGYLPAAAANGRAGFFGFRRPGGPLLQFDLVLVTSDRLVTTATGAAGRDVASDLYHALFLREIDFAIDHGFAGLDFGPGAYPDKLRFGCDLEERHAFPVSRGPWPRP